jgi:hypothetical protein
VSLSVWCVLRASRSAPVLSMVLRLTV